MVRAQIEARGLPSCSPHPRGDGPPSPRTCPPCMEFSPPAWGWSGLKLVPVTPSIVLPTRVGMVRSHWQAACCTRCSPHPRGDGPWAGWSSGRSNTFSPPAWGWSGARDGRDAWQPVLPTRVGMVRKLGKAGEATQGSPHPRGDGPTSIHQWRDLTKFSPPAWGWSAQVDKGARDVLPTRVGMVRDRDHWRCCILCSPHPRGDGPRCYSGLTGTRAFSPPAWGWSVRRR